MHRNLSIIDFNELNQHERYDQLFTKGDFINCYLKGDCRYALYSLFKFFVEVEYNVIQNKIVNLIAFKEGQLLERYWILTELK